MGIRLISGRDFTELDSQNAPGVIVINETMARRYWPDEDPLGKRIKIGDLNSDNPWLTVVLSRTAPLPGSERWMKFFMTRWDHGGSR